MFGLTVDYTKKVLHFVINTALTAETNNTRHEGLVIYPPNCFSKVNTMAEFYFKEFFKPGQQFKTICVETEMGPGELANVLASKFGAEVSMGIGGMITMITIDPAGFDKFVQKITLNPRHFLASKEKKIFAKDPIPGVFVTA